MYPFNYGFPKKALVSSITQTMGFESGVTVVQARSIINDRFSDFSTETDCFIKSGFYKSELVKRLKKQKDDLDRNILLLTEKISSLGQILEVSNNDDFAKKRADHIKNENRLSFLRLQLSNLETTIADKNG